MNVFWAGLMLTILVFVGIPFLVFFLGLIFSGGMGTVIGIGSLLVAGFLIMVLTAS